VIFLTLPTPNDGYNWGLDALVEGTRAVGRAIGESAAFQTVVVRSTVPPRCCESLIVPVHESGARVSEGFAVASNPEFLRARSALDDSSTPGSCCARHRVASAETSSGRAATAS
jgi:UDPglucose 6-dehydrogenase